MYFLMFFVSPQKGVYEQEGLISLKIRSLQYLYWQKFSVVYILFTNYAWRNSKTMKVNYLQDRTLAGLCLKTLLSPGKDVNDWYNFCSVFSYDIVISIISHILSDHDLARS